MQFLCSPEVFEMITYIRLYNNKETTCIELKYQFTKIEPNHIL